MFATVRERRLVWPAVATIIAFLILVSLGRWQLDRLAWKEALITAIAERTKAEPVELLNAYSASYPSDLGYEYMRVKAKGRFLNSKERYLYAPDPDAGPGFEVLTPFATADGPIVFVNRGYVPEARQNPATRAAGLIEGDTEVVGLLRNPAMKGTFTPDNDPAHNLWFWRDPYGLAASAFTGEEGKNVLPVFLDAEAPAPGGWPRGGATRLELPNRHLEYALTWFGLAAALLGVFAAFAITRLRAPTA
jgi:surfeit locus 1 family protein